MHLKREDNGVHRNVEGIGRFSRLQMSCKQI